MKNLKDEIKGLIIDYILKNYSNYEWYEKGENYFALAVKFNDKLEGVEWSIINDCNKPKIRITLSVFDKNILGKTSYIKVDIDEWNLIPTTAECWNTHDNPSEFKRINN